jgi:carboxyl-terminal processing protease
MLGTIGMLSSVLLGMLSLAALRRVSQPFPPELTQELDQLKRKLGLRRALDGRLTDRRAIPMTWGWLRPVILLPDEAIQWTRERRQMVLLHELAHIQRSDFAVQLLGQVSRAIHWFNPLAWWALGRLRIEQERACDDVVISAGQCAADYALELMRVTARLPRSDWSLGVALAFRRRSSLPQRLQAILDTSRDRRPVTAGRRAVLSGALAAIVGLVAVTRFTAGQAHAQPAPEPAAASSDTPAQRTAPAKADPAVRSATTEAERDLTNVRELIQKLSSQDLDAKRLDEAAIRGMLESLKDPYSELLSGDQFREMQRHLNGHIVGIGAQLAQEQDVVTIVTPLADSPAAKSGLKPKDRILAVDGKALSKLTDVVEAIRGPQGTTVSLRILRGAEEIEVTVTRDAVQLAPVRGLWLDASGQWRYWLDDAAQIAYLQIVEFSQRTPVEMELGLARLQERGLKGLVIDLRGCPGGLLEESVKVASMFIKQGKVASVRGRQGMEQALEVDGTARYADLPLIVLIDDATASAAEVFAAAIQDHQRGIVIGERTLGKGSLQALVPVSNFDANLKITTAQILRSSGASLAATVNATTWGVDPTDGYYIPLTAEQRTMLRDAKMRRDAMGALNLSDALTPDQVRAELADPALAAALQSIAAKVSTGNFEATGRPRAEMTAVPRNREALRHQRDALRKQLEEIDKQLGNVR